ncbi:hypothetical protein predicted by Glimmer/Critica [Streptococcus dysgalactiae subsp. equisimilis AC-2713]|uniref:Uncharacterized protein n=1 Tax=Streptococcus dysgalactiae subsp. equisimilis AC-2713 TaxID=759913 RepID=A0AB33R794_STREQ|nr:hypothetical protein predicted by Glimmer/Critica [Streptococcus dysgalactiae subsp. equisimilis AC-2713]
MLFVNLGYQAILHFHSNTFIPTKTQKIINCSWKKKS